MPTLFPGAGALTRVLACAAVVFTASYSPLVSAEEADTPTWEELAEGRDPAPAWFRDAKFGIYFHWGVYSVPAYGNEWYPHRMHKPGESCNKHHLAKYGDPAEYGYERFVDDFKAEQFDAKEWVDLFVKSGARFVGPVAEHHDGFAMWDSEATPWNSVDRGPKRDIVGEITDAARERGLKTVATFHHARNRLWRKDGKWTGHYLHAMNHYPAAFDNAERAFMYGKMSEEEFLAMWLEKLREVIDAYKPDLIWFDSWLHEIPHPVMRQFAAHYIQSAAAEGREVVITYKQKDMPQTVGVLDIEKGGMGELYEHAWLSDDTISLGSWCYTEDLRIKEPAVVLHNLVDIVSKNGQLILNLSPTADGVIPENQRSVLLALGEWLGKYGESIYDTRPFHMYGHGPTKPGKGHFGGVATDKAYTAGDIRYTRKGNVVYAIQLGRPQPGDKALLTGFAKDSGEAEVEGVTLLGGEAAVAWEQTDEGLVVSVDKLPSEEMANVYKVVLKK